MTGNRYRKSTQKEFLSVAAGNPVYYVYPDTFHAGNAEVTLRPERIAAFAAKLSAVLPFAEYERLTREIWICHLREQTVPNSPEF